MLQCEAGGSSYEPDLQQTAPVYENSPSKHTQTESIRILESKQPQKEEWSGSVSLDAGSSVVKPAECAVDESEPIEDKTDRIINPLEGTSTAPLMMPVTSNDYSDVGDVSSVIRVGLPDMQRSLNKGVKSVVRLISGDERLNISCCSSLEASALNYSLTS